MTADYELELKVLGNGEQLKKMLGVVGEYANAGNKSAYFSALKVDGKELDFSNIPDDCVAGGAVTVTALGPYGHYGELNDVSIFRDLADVFPDASFFAEISGNGQYETQNLKCELKDGKLNIEIYFESNDESGDAWADDFMKKIPLKKFKRVFKIEGEDFDEVSYKYVLDSISMDYCDDLSEMDFDDFSSYLEENEGETELDEDEFAEIVENKLSTFGIVSRVEFEDDHEGGSTSHYIYDPTTKSYVGKEKPIFGGVPSGQTFNATDIITKGLKAKGAPADADSVANLSIEDAYAALAAGMGLGADDEDEDDNEEE